MAIFLKAQKMVNLAEKRSEQGRLLERGGVRAESLSFLFLT